MLTKLKQFFVKQEITDIKSVPADDSVLQQWPLLQRIDFIQQNYHFSAKEIDTLAPDFLEKPQLSLAEHDANEEALLELVDQLRLTGGTVYLPSQCIQLTKTLKLPAFIQLIGVSGQSLLQFNQVDDGIVIEGNAEHIFLKNIMIKHIGSHHFGAAIRMSHCHDIQCHNITIINPSTVGFLLADKVSNVTFEQCRVSKAGVVGFMLVRDVYNTTMRDCIAEGCEQSGLFLTDLKCPASIDLLDFDAQIHHTTQVIGNFAPFDFDDPAPNRTTLLNCTFQNNRKMGITTDGTGLLRVINCIIRENDGEGIALDNGTWQCQIQGCHIYGNGWRGLQSEEELGIDFVAEMGLMDDGSSKAKLPGISLDNAAYCRIENNCIEQNWGDGVKFVRAGFACTIKNNQILSNNQGQNDKFHFFGILLGNAERQHPDQHDFTSRYNNVTHNDILGSHYVGIHILRHVRDNTVENNWIEGAKEMAIDDHNDERYDEILK